MPRATSSASCRATTASGVPERPTSDPWDRVEDSLDTLVPPNANQPYDMHELIRKTVDEGDFFEIQPEPRRQHHLRLRPGRGAHRGRGRQPADGACRRARHQRQQEGRALRAFLRCVLDPDRHVRRCAGLPPRHRAGAQRHHQARRQAAVRLCRGDRAEDHRDHPQGLWRRLRRDGQSSTCAATSTMPGRPPRSP